jgi:Uncharacterized conserved protein
MGMSKKPVRIGCCGFRSSRESYYASLPAVEIQHTFYQPPQLGTLRRWRDEAPEGFEFTIKAWQLITHESRSPTYKRLKRELSSTERDGAGFFRPSPIVKEAWDVTRMCAKALGARVVLFQCPASFRPTGDNVENMLRFFSEADRAGLTFVWEPRGDWPGELIKDLCKDLDLWHVVDPFAGRTLTPRRCYFRLHGRGGWRYSYEDEELEELYSLLPRGARSYVFFNNVEMRRDALRFKEIAETAD